jgi:hypothetical protein
MEGNLEEFSTLRSRSSLQKGLLASRIAVLLVMTLSGAALA